MARGRSGSRVDTTLGILLMGEEGTWKSSLSLESLKLKYNGRPARVLYIDAENGSVDTFLEDYEDEGYDLNNLYLYYTQDIDEIIDVIDKAKDGKPFYQYDDDGNETEEVVLDGDGQPFKPDFIVLDGLKMVHSYEEITRLEHSERRTKVKVDADEGLSDEIRRVKVENADLEFKDYKKLNHLGDKIILKLISSGCDWCATSFAKPEMVEDSSGAKDKQGNVIKYKSGKMIPDGFKNLIKYAKTVIVLRNDDDYGTVVGKIQNKDRTKTYKQQEEIVNPTITAFQPIIDKRKGKTFVVSYDDTKPQERGVDYHEDDNNNERPSSVPVPNSEKPADYIKYIKDTIEGLNKTDKPKMLKSMVEKYDFKPNFKTMTKKENLETLQIWAKGLYDEVNNKA